MFSVLYFCMTDLLFVHYNCETQVFKNGRIILRPAKQIEEEKQAGWSHPDSHGWETFWYPLWCTCRFDCSACHPLLWVLAGIELARTQKCWESTEIIHGVDCKLFGLLILLLMFILYWCCNPICIVLYAAFIFTAGLGWPAADCHRIS